MEAAQDYKQLLTDIIKKQIVLLGPDITMAQVKKVSGLTVAEDGTVNDVQGDAKMVMHDVINVFVELSGDIVKKAMEPLFEAQPQPVAPKIELPAAPIQPAPEVAKPEPAAEPTQPAPTESAPTTAAPAEPTPTQENRPLMQVEEVSTPPVDQSLSMPTVTPTPQPMQQETPAPEPQPAAQPEATPAAPVMPTVEPAQPAAESQPAATPAPQGTQTPAANPQAQNDPDMQHIINEALKQTQ